MNIKEKERKERKSGRKKNTKRQSIHSIEEE
jgi:hypothetical protein